MPFQHFGPTTTLTTHLPPRQRYWLFATGSMTKRLAHFAGEKITVNVLIQHWAKPDLAEQQQLKLPANRYCLIREVELYAADELLMIARSVLPQGALTKQYQMLPGLINKTIGQWFYKNPKLIRSDFRYQQLDLENQQKLWARRSVFTTPEQRLLLTEIFMPILFQEQNV